MPTKLNVQALKFLQTALVTSFALVSLSLLPAKALNIQIITDNDFALFSGTSASINTLLFQNNVTWSAQLAAQTGCLPAVPAGDTLFYLLAMGGGGQEEVMGSIDGKNITTFSGVLVSNNLVSSLSGCNASAVSSGSYNASVANVQAAFAGSTFQAPSLGCYYVCTNYGTFANRQSFVFDLYMAHIYAFKIPGPLPVARLLAGLSCSRKIRQRIRLRRS